MRFTFPVAPLMVASAREIEARRGASNELYLPCCTSHGHECKGDKGIEEEEAARRGREALPLSLLL
jgi:hypothetical protein